MAEAARCLEGSALPGSFFSSDFVPMGMFILCLEIIRKSAIFLHFVLVSSFDFPSSPLGGRDEEGGFALEIKVLQWCLAGTARKRDSSSGA